MAAIGLKKRILFIDNLDSFTYNIVHGLSVGGAQVDVVRIDELVAVDQADWLLGLQKYDGYVVGPGPGQPHSHHISAIPTTNLPDQPQQVHQS